MLHYLQLFAETWYIVFAAISAMILCIMKIVEFVGYPTERKKEEIRTRLLEYTTAAELALGSGTGRLKLAQAYDYFCQAFPYTKKWFTLEQFSDLVDEVLPTMREVLENKSTD